MKRNKYSFFYLLKYDFLVGVILSWKKYFVTACIFIISALFFNQAISVHFLNIKVGFLDYIIEIFKGVPIYIPSSYKTFSIPGIWILLFLYFFYMFNCYPLSDIHSYGQQVLLRSQKRIYWWLSKCLWLAIGIFIFYVIGYFILLLFTLGTGHTFFEMNHEVNAAVTKINTSNARTQDIFYVGILLPFIVSMAIAFIQLIISFITDSLIFGYIAIIILLVASAYKCHPLLLGNYLMLNRNNLFISDGVSANTGIIISIICIALSIAIGAKKIQHYDVMASKK
ncbi:hypothetical protein [Caproicibacter fermentans]|uniref:Uncharacterized protein n=1 Tax=Caproicibacter fermentans TaxID=2576756 RepID=A0A7G8TEK4_9FIRM|nr:hypothetical protein [Caproicibacter fermentans]QNK42045.1 hypothetical protein HCR03_07405 [Caproicibacter fermentans]